MSTITAKVDFSPWAQIELPLENINGTNIQVDWGDGSPIETFVNGTGYATHFYRDNYTYDYKYEIIITGNITGLGDSAFRSRYYVEVKLSEGITTIGNYCFRDSKIEQLTIPKTVTSIGDQFNCNNTSLKTLTINGNNLTTIGTDFCFGTSSLATLKLADSITNIGLRAFSLCASLKEFTVPLNLTGFSTYFLQSSSLDLTLKFNNGPISNPPINENTKIIVPLSKLQEFLNHPSYPNERDRYGVYGKNLSEKIYALGEEMALNLTNKGVNASADDGLTTLANKIDDISPNIPRVIIEDDTVTDFADLRFTFVFPKNCRKIRDNALTYWENLKHCILPEGPSSIEFGAFAGCSNLVEITIPNTITSIGSSVFADTTSLNKIVFKNTTPPTVQYDTFSNLLTTCIIEVPIGSLKTYKNALNYPDPNTNTYRSLYYANDFSDSSTISDFTDSKGTITKSITNGELVLTAPNNDEHLTYCNKAKLPKGDWKVTINSTTYNFIAVKIGYDPLDPNATVFDCIWNYGWGLVKINSDWSQTTVKPLSSIYLGTTGVWVFEYIDKVMKIYKDNVLKATYDLTSYDTIGGYVMIGDCCNRTNKISELIIEEL